MEVGQRDFEDVSERDFDKEMVIKLVVVYDIIDDGQEEIFEIIEQIFFLESNLEELI